MAIIPLQSEFTFLNLTPICIATGNDPKYGNHVFLFMEESTQHIYFQFQGPMLPFKLLPWEYMSQFHKQLCSDTRAYKALSHLPIREAIEAYIKVAYGHITHRYFLELMN